MYPILSCILCVLWIISYHIISCILCVLFGSYHIPYCILSLYLILTDSYVHLILYQLILLQSQSIVFYPPLSHFILSPDPSYPILSTPIPSHMLIFAGEER